MNGKPVKPQYLAQLYTHLIFSTRDCALIIKPEDSEDLRVYIGGIFRERESPFSAVGAVEDHVQILYRQSIHRSIADVVKHVKSGSAKWMKALPHGDPDFQWQAGFGVFSVSQSKLDAVEHYIRTQEEHHKTTNYKDEFRRLLREYHIEYVERYVWD